MAAQGTSCLSRTPCERDKIHPRRCEKTEIPASNPKVRKVQVPPTGVDLTQVAESCRYVGSPYHKDAPGFSGMPRGPRPNATLCPRELVNCRDLVEGVAPNCRAIRSGRGVGRTLSTLHLAPRR